LSGSGETDPEKLVAASQGRCKDKAEGKPMTETSQFLISHGLAIIFGVVFAEQMGIPIPAAPWLLAAGALSADGKLNPIMGVGLTVLACILADTFWFYLGRWRGPQVLGWLCRISLEPDSCIRRTQNLFTRYGLRGLLVAKFVPGFGGVARPLAGMAGIRTRQFILVDAIGSLAYAVCCLGFGFLFSRQLSQIVTAISRLGSGAVALLVSLVVPYLAYKYWQRRRLLRQLSTSRITVAELRQKLDAGEKIAIYDLRSSAELELNPTVIRGAIHMEVEKLAAHSDSIPKDRDIVAYCSCPNEVTSARFALLLHKKGFLRIRPLLGGIEAWRKLDYPMDAWPSTLTVTTDAN
jgi:membrane protein DedA with SNARE-associated domain/rhodanese-related sulfurtransferase